MVTSLLLTVHYFIVNNLEHVWGARGKALYNKIEVEQFEHVQGGQSWGWVLYSEVQVEQV